MTDAGYVDPRLIAAGVSDPSPWSTTQDPGPPHPVRSHLRPLAGSEAAPILAAREDRMADERYLPTHEWARAEGDTVVIGLSPFAAGEVGDVIHVALPKVGQRLSRGKACAEIESVKSVNDFYSPVDGEVVAVNAALAESPELVNRDALGQGWFAKVRPAAGDALAGLMASADYAATTRK